VIINSQPFGGKCQKPVGGFFDSHCTPVKYSLPKIGIAIEIASMSVANLLVLPVWSTGSTSGLYLMVLYIDSVDESGSRSGVTENSAVS